MWWPFAKRGTRVDAPIKLDLPVPLPGDLSVFARNDACIKLWLPEKLTQALEQMSGCDWAEPPRCPALATVRARVWQAGIRDAESLETST